jgi:hypothetical protein
MQRLPLLVGLLVSTPLVAQRPHWGIVDHPAVSDGSGICCQIEIAPDGTPWIAFQDQSLPSIRCSVMRLQDGAFVYAGGKGNASNGQAWYNKLAFDASGRPYLACRDYSAGGRVSVRTYDAATDAWSNVGPPGSSAGEAHYTDIAIAPDGTPTVVYADRTTTPADRTTSLSFHGGAWQTLGTVGFSPSGAGYPSIDVDAQGVVHAAFSDAGMPDTSSGTGRASVMRYDAASASWSFVGVRGFSPHGTLNLTLAIDRLGQPWVAYYVWHSSIVVMRFDGTSWVQVGGSAAGGDAPEVQTEGWRQWLSIDFDSQNAPYVAYQRWNHGNRAAVRRWDGTSWAPVGNLGFSAGAADYLALAIGPEDVPYVVFRDASLGQKVTVMRHAPSPQTYCSGVVSSLGCLPSIAVSGDPSLSGTGPFWITATNVISHRTGILLYSDLPDRVPFAGGGALCLRSPVLRAGVVDSGGIPGAWDCSGVLRRDFGPTLRSGHPMFTAGARIFAQYYYRDHQNPNGPGLSNGVRFEVLN